MKLTKFLTAFAVDEVGQIALVLGASERIENQSVVAEFLFGHAVGARVVLVALHVVLVLMRQIGVPGILDRRTHKLP